MLKDYCTQIVEVSPFTKDRLFYKVFFKKDDDTHCILFNQMMTIYVTKLRQKQNNKEFQPLSWETKLKQLFSLFKNKE